MLLVMSGEDSKKQVAIRSYTLVKHLPTVLSSYPTPPHLQVFRVPVKSRLTPSEARREAFPRGWLRLLTCSISQACRQLGQHVIATSLNYLE
jgi:hypothetical protein